MEYGSCNAHDSRQRQAARLRWWLPRKALRCVRLTVPQGSTILASVLVLLTLSSSPMKSMAAAPQQSLDDVLSEAKQLEAKQNYAGAIKAYQQGLRAFPNQPELLKRLGIMYQTELKFAESIQTFQKVLQIDPQYPETNFYLGVSYLGYNDYERALGYFNQELKYHPDYRRAHLYAAKTLLALGREGEAVEQYQILTRQDPKDARVWFEVASLYRSLAMHAYQQLESIDPDSVLLDVLRAEADADDLRYQEAIQRYQKALQKQPDFPGLHFALGEIYFKTDKPAQAEPELRLALKEDPGNPPANYMLGQMLLRDAKPDEALHYLQVAVNGDPTFMKAHLELGKCDLRLGKIQEAQQALLRATEVDPHAPEPHVLLVQVYTRLKDDAKRTTELETVRRLEQESHARVQNNLEKASQKNQ
jgi:tetratricopeptide (TPR) repeat protein